jgi:uncharacterized membrane protein
MDKNRLEAFSDGVLAVIITVMVLNIKIPSSSSFNDLKKVGPIFFTYILSFILIGIYWSNHHHFFKAVKEINGKVIWANLHLLFWLSLYPFVTVYVGENKFAALPVAVYATVGFFSALAYFLVTKSTLSEGLHNPLVEKAIGNDRKEKLSAILTLISIPVAFINQYVSIGIFILVALIWVTPDKRIEKLLL